MKEKEKKDKRGQKQKRKTTSRETVKEIDRTLTLPVDQIRVGDHPGFQHTPELAVALRR